VSTKKFKAKIKKEEGTATYIDIPFNVEKEFGGKGRVAVKVTINGFPYRTSIVSKGNGTHWMCVNKSMRDGGKVKVGDIAQFTMEKDTEIRTVEIPSDLKNALDKNPKAKAIFEKYPYTHRKEFVQYINEAKKEETRIRRIEKTIEMLLQKKNLSTRNM
jgi:hypothetical protein